MLIQNPVTIKNNTEIAATQNKNLPASPKI